jgi:hypothetical protein
VLYNVSGGKMYKGAGSGTVVCTWSGDRLSAVELAATVWFVEHPY